MRLPFGIRRWLVPLVRWIPLRIRRGPNRGFRWSLAASGRHAGGRFEPRRVETLLGLVSEGDCVWDVGAHHGYVAHALSRKVGTRGRVVAFEPSPYNLKFLRIHLGWNGLSNVRVVPVALGDRDGTARFGGRGSSQTFRLGAGGTPVRTATIPTLLSEEGLPAPDLLKLDVEGAEGRVLEAGARHLPAGTAVLVSLHSRESHDRVRTALTAAGFEMLESPGVRRRVRSGSWDTADPDVLAARGDRKALLDRARRLPSFS